MLLNTVNKATDLGSLQHVIFLQCPFLETLRASMLDFTQLVLVFGDIASGL